MEWIREVYGQEGVIPKSIPRCHYDRKTNQPIGKWHSMETPQEEDIYYIPGYRWNRWNDKPHGGGNAVRGGSTYI